MSKILSFNLQEEKQTAVRLLCLRMGFQFLVIDPSRQNQTIGALCGITKSVSADDIKDCFKDEMLVFYGLNRDELNEFLELMRSNNLSILLKAIVTDTNKNWTASKVFHALQAENRKLESLKKRKKRK